MHVRATTGADIPAIMAIERQPGFERLVGRSSEQEHKTMMAVADYRYLLLEDETGMAQGFAILQGVGSSSGVVYLKRIAVRAPGHGAGKAFVNELIRLSFDEFSADKFWLDAFEHNTRARHAYATCGLVEDGVLREHYPLDGKRVDLVIMSILKREWLAGPAKTA